MAALMAGTAISAQAQDLKGKVIGTDGKPISGVVISSPGCKIARSAEDGSFTFSGLKGDAAVTFKHAGFYNKVENVKTSDFSDAITVHMISEKVTRYNESVVLPDGLVEGDQTLSGKPNVNRKDFALGTMTVEDAMRGLNGLQVTGKSGMPGEGAYIQLRGIHTFFGDNQPLYVINGIPFLPDMSDSKVISGYSRSVFEALNGQDIKNITVLKGGEAAIYGSLAGNGVVLIETDQPTDETLNTRISFNALYGVNWNKRRIPLMDAMQYKGYLTDIGLTHTSKYKNQEDFFKDFTFLSDPSAANADLYANNTNWQDQVLRNSSTMDFLFRVEGGDNIAKYNISLGYMGNNGTIKNTNLDRYHAQINASVLISRKLQILASVNTAYLTGNFAEQGLSYETNPLLTSYRRSPLLSPYRSDIYGKLISNYSTYGYGVIDDPDYYVSNPLAVASTIDAKQRQYDLNARANIVYTPNQFLTFNAIVGFYYNYMQENTFIPGITDNSVLYLSDRFGKAENTVRAATNYTFNMYYNINGTYKRTFNDVHALKVTAGAHMTHTSYENDAAFARNTPNDFYRTMGDATGIGKYFDGYNRKWGWLNMYLNAGYTYNDLVRVGFVASVDGSSTDSQKSVKVFNTSAEAALMLKQLPGLRKANFLNKWNIYANASILGNSRFDTKSSRSYYTSVPYLQIAGIVRGNLATTDRLKAERSYNVNVGTEVSVWNNRASLALEYYSSRSADVIVAGTNSPLLGTTPYLANAAEITSRGVELKVGVIPVMTKDFTWTIGATVNTLNNKVKSLGKYGDITYNLDDDAQLITRVGESPYSFYGYQTRGVYSTTEDANNAHIDANGINMPLVNAKGVAYKAGDVCFVDQNGDGRIDDADKVVLGSGIPTAFGSIFTRFEYKGFALDLDFGYSTGAKMYNAVRRITESATDLSNQSTAVMRRWSMEGQVTDMPRAEWGDPRGNNAFSDRWIEDADYVKLRTITLSYTHNKPLWNFIQGVTIYATGENLINASNYYGLDPETSYSYSPMMQGIDYGKLNAPRSVKFGVNLKF